MLGLSPNADCAHAGEETGVIGEEDEDKDAANQGHQLARCRAPGRPLEDAHDEADDHLDQALCTARHFLEVAGNQPPAEQNQAHDDEHREHGIRHRDRSDVEQRLGCDLDVNFHSALPASLPLPGLAICRQFPGSCHAARNRTNLPGSGPKLGQLPKLVSGQEQSQSHPDECEQWRSVRQLIEEQPTQNANQHTHDDGAPHSHRHTGRGQLLAFFGSRLLQHVRSPSAENPIANFITMSE
jgi:hypothetical protein